SSRRRHTRWPRDWSSDVCSSDLTLVGERVKLAVFAARVDAGGKITQQRAIELTSSERTVEMLRIDARQHRAQAAVDHFFSQSRRSEERRVGKEWRMRGGRGH